MECFRLLLEHLAGIEHQFLSGIRDSRKAGSLWGGDERCERSKEVNTPELIGQRVRVRVGLLFWGFNGVQKISRRKWPTLFKSGQWHFHQDNTPVHNSILVTDYLTKMGIKTVPHSPYNPDLAPCDFWLFPKLRGCRYETIEEMKEAVTKFIDTLTQEDFDGAFQKLLETVQQVHCNRRRLLRRGTSQTCRTLLEKQGRTHKWCTLMDPHTWPSKSRTTSTNIHPAAMWGYGMLSWRPT